MTDQQQHPDLEAVPEASPPTAAEGTPAPSPAELEAQADEQAALNAAMRDASLQYLQARVVTLNLAVRQRDKRIAELEAELEASGASE